ncbi:MAG: UDP-2,4-diacetamido-2,4,6-trideoxy-beta-L-altropyranose hydrolase [Phenylobacterium sp.]
MIPETPRVLFIADAGPEAGGGHLMRSLTLSEALSARGADCAFLATSESAALLETFAPGVSRIETAGTDRAALAAALAGQGFDALVFDHYRLSRPDHDALAGGRACLVIDDLADRPLGADVVLDSGPDRRPSDYTLLTDGDTRLLLGPAFAPVRSRFAALRASSLARRGGAVGRVLVTMGLSDVGGVTGRVVDRLRPRLGDVIIDVVLGGQAQSRKVMMRMATHDRRLRLHVDATDMASLLHDADFVISAAGSTVWEICTLGLPSAIVVVADNQRAAAGALAQRGAALVVDASDPAFEGALDRALMRLISDPVQRAHLSEAAANVCDGQGAGRAADALLQAIAVRGKEG